MRFNIIRLGIASMVTLAPPCLAYTECQTSVVNAYTDVDGTVWFTFANGQSGYAVGTAVGREAVLASALTSMTTGRGVNVRYATDGVSCTAAGVRSDFVGLWMAR